MPLFQKAVELSGSPNARLYVARCLRELGRPVDAYDEARRTVAEAGERAAKEPKYAETRDLAAAELALIERKIGRVVVALADPPPGAEVSVNGRPLPLDRLGRPFAIEPGPVTVEATAPGAASARQEVGIPAGEMKTVALALSTDRPAAVAPAPAPRPPAAVVAEPGGGGVRVGGFVVAGVGVVGFATFAVAGSMAASDFAEVERGCGAQRCVDPKYDDVISRGRTLDTVANIGLVVGVLGLAAGAAMIVFGGPSSSATTTAQLTFSSTGATASAIARFWIRVQSMINNTGSASVFHDSARELASRLEGDSSPAAQEMVQEALTLAETFRRWELQRPEDGPRVATIRRLFELNRRAMDYLASNHHPR